MIINETVKLSAKPAEPAELNNYTLGFPYAYQSNLDYAFAYEPSNPNSKLRLDLDVGLGRIGFYGVNVVFPQPVNLSNVGSYEFTVVFVFSNSVSVNVFQVGETLIMYNASFPAYPSLLQNASEANLTIIFPTGLDYTSSSFAEEGVNFTRTISDSKQYFNYLKSNLTEFSDQNGWFAFAATHGTLRIFEVNEVKREIVFSTGEQIVVSDSYRMVSKTEALSQIQINLPKDAFDESAFDEVGNKLSTKRTGTQTNLTITFAIPYGQDKEARFTVRYQLPWKNITTTENWSSFHVNLTLFENFNWTVRKWTINVILPEGATLVSPPSSASLSNIQNGVFTSSFSLVFQNVTPFHNLSFDFRYGRVAFWESFRPTLWMGALVIIIGVIVGAWRSYRPAAAPIPTAIIRVRVDELKKFVDSYDEKRRFQREIESLEAQARKGKIPRRLYKVRRTTVENRLGSLSRDLAALREKIHMAGPRYADLMRQLEVAEFELQGVEADINRTEIGYRRGEISAAAYHKRLEDLYRRRDRAQTTIDGVLLRIREEIS